MDMLTKIQANILLCEALKQMLVYAKFMKEHVLGKCKLMYYENITMEKEWSVIIERKLPPKLIDLGRFTNPCSIFSLTIDHTL